MTNKDEDAVLVHGPHAAWTTSDTTAPGLFTDDGTVDYGPVVMGGLRLERSSTFSGRFPATRQSGENVLAGLELEVSVRSSVFTWHETRYGAVPRIPRCDQDRVSRTLH